jgi:Cu2+-exporting ATPase
MSLASSSTHPRADAIRRALLGRARAVPLHDLEEHPGQGMEAEVNGDIYRLGSSSFALTSANDADPDVTVFAKNGEGLAAFSFAEDLRADATREVALLRGMGLSVNVLSGDSPDRVRALAELLGIDAEDAFGGARPEDKAAFLRARADVPTLFVGDGLNDTLAASAAFLSGTPAIDRPFLPARTDFHFTAGHRDEKTGGLAPIRALLLVGRRLRRVTRRNLAFAFAYNAFAIAVAASGQMHPWLAAVLMPLSSLAVIGSAALAFPSGHARRTVRPTPLAPEAAWKS